jgi:hypothetical protein
MFPPFPCLQMNFGNTHVGKLHTTENIVYGSHKTTNKNEIGKKWHRKYEYRVLNMSSTVHAEPVDTV